MSRGSYPSRHRQGRRTIPITEGVSGDPRITRSEATYLLRTLSILPGVCPHGPPSARGAPVEAPTGARMTPSRQGAAGPSAALPCPRGEITSSACDLHHISGQMAGGSPRAGPDPAGLVTAGVSPTTPHQPRDSLPPHGEDGWVAPVTATPMVTARLPPHTPSREGAHTLPTRGVTSTPGAGPLTVARRRPRPGTPPPTRRSWTATNGRHSRKPLRETIDNNAQGIQEFSENLHE